MSALSVTITMLAHSLCWALLYSLWQGLFIYVALSLAFKAMPGLNAKAKYFLSYTSFTGLFIWFISTWVSRYHELSRAVSYTLSISNPATAGVKETTNVTNPATATEMWHYLTHLLPLYFPYVISVYIIGLVFMSGRFIVNILQVQRLGTKNTVPAAVQRQEFIDEWRHNLGIRKAVRILLSNRVTVPVMIGAIKPIILLPVAAISQLSTQEVEAILLHELAHIKRHDYLLNIFQTIGETILFFNPFVWLLSAIIRREREHCCDDLVVACYSDPLPYAKALATLEHTRLQSEQLSLAVTGHKNQLLNRIKRIMEMKTNKINYSQFTIIMAVFITIAFAIAMFSFTPVFAQKAKTDNTDSIKKKTVCQITTINRSGQNTADIKHSDDDNNDENDMNDETDANDTGNHKTITKTFSYTYNNTGDDKVNAEDIDKEIRNATKEASDAIASIDFKEINKEIKAAQQEINSVDWDQVRENINKGMEEINKQLNDKKFKESIDDNVKQSLEESKKALEDAMHEINENTGHKEGMIEKSRQHKLSGYSSNMEEMVAEMKKDGLINGKHYTIKKDGDVLYINGKKQPQDVYNKYRKYLEDNDMVMNTSQLTIHANKITITQ